MLGSRAGKGMAILPENLESSVEVRLIHKSRIGNFFIMFREVGSPAVNANEDDTLLFWHLLDNFSFPG